jgi:hypothetical protein
VRLQVFVARGYALFHRAPARAMRLANHFPEVHVKVVELDEQRTVPDRVTATATHLWELRVL